MAFLFDFFPLILFFGAFKFYGIYVATAVAIAASVVQIGVQLLQKKKVSFTHWMTAMIILVFGGLTLILQDDVFIKWKPSIVNWAFAIALLGTQFIGKKTGIEYVMGSQICVPQNIWRRMNLSWAIFFIALGLLNAYVAFYYRIELDEITRTDFWVNFKVFGLMGLTFAFVIIQMLMISKHITTKETENTAEENP